MYVYKYIYIYIYIHTPREGGKERERWQFLVRLVHAGLHLNGKWRLIVALFQDLQNFLRQATPRVGSEFDHPLLF